MGKVKMQYRCSACQSVASRWMGKCSSCGAWNTLLEQEIESVGVSKAVAFKLDVGQGGAQSLKAVSEDAEKGKKRFKWATGLGELDRVLGGGLVQDGFVLLGGDPGIGKSTLLLQLAQGIVSQNAANKVLYASGEESLDQIFQRSTRLGIPSSDQIILVSEIQIEKVAQLVKTIRPTLLIVDSLQTFCTDEHPSSPGSITQVREVTSKLMTLAKSTQTAVCLVGHVTKEGSIAGPKTVEHMVDTVLYFESDINPGFRLLRTVKNRFGSTHELGVFEMLASGLKSVLNPSELFLSQRSQDIAGVTVSVPIEGTRPLLVEIQALTTPNSYAQPRRICVGFDPARLSILAAVLEKYLEIELSKLDLFFNVTGGFKLQQPACDLAALTAVWSAACNVKLPRQMVSLGEVSLTGEIRPIHQLLLRVEEAVRLGYERIVIPSSTAEKTLKEVEAFVKGLKTPFQVHLIANINGLGRLLMDLGG